ncbi:M23 family metallopeptidase [Amycolatopsis echigonensis]|uniref:M23 family metallopeptidase n=1 Tax=Amycolatopsis echigonensis TaxID=2576905 RepID=UPI001FCA04C3|nr:M23 family metallopeptidase [Amycolatopsis niigatensis]
MTGTITSNYGARSGTTHDGLDVANAIGAPVRTPLAGTVIEAGPASGFGLWVRVRHEDGTVTGCGHLNRYPVSVGQRAAAGQVIAEAGKRGQSTGPHLHLEAWSAGERRTDPLRWPRGLGVRIGPRG